jgi:hypothetical protein
MTEEEAPVEFLFNGRLLEMSRTDSVHNSLRSVVIMKVTSIGKSAMFRDRENGTSTPYRILLGVDRGLEIPFVRYRQTHS